jgi:cytidyltransferase-like protein
MKVVLVTGGFDPLHSGHIAYFKSAQKLGDKLVVGVNSDAWLTRKKGRPFMPGGERTSIIQNLTMVDHCVLFDDDDNTSKEAIKNVRFMYPDAHIIFANGGDRTSDNIPEMDTEVENISFVFGVGGEDKKNSSSWILKEWSQPTTERAWGRYTVLDKGEGWQVKQLEFDAGKALSDQRHSKRSEHWHVVEGIIRMDLEYQNGDTKSKTYYPGSSIDIPHRTWHKATNIGDVTARVVEVWLGVELTEEDIERRD